MKKFIAVDFYDLIWKQETVFSLEDMEALFARYAENGINAVLWRLSVYGKLLYHSKTPDRYTIGGAPQGVEAKALKVMET